MRRGSVETLAYTKDALRIVATLVLLMCSSTVTAQELQLPFNGRWFVMQGGDTLNVNQHMSLLAQAFGMSKIRPS